MTENKKEKDWLGFIIKYLTVIIVCCIILMLLYMMWFNIKDFHELNKIIVRSNFKTFPDSDIIEFVKNYYTTQSGWLTFWLTSLGVFSAVVIGWFSYNSNKKTTDLDYKIKEFDERSEKSIKNSEDSINKVKTEFEKMKTEFEKMKTEFYEMKKGLEITNNQMAMNYFNSGNKKLELKEYKEAIKDYEEAIIFNSKYVEVYHNIGIAKNELGMYEEAIKYYEKVIELNPNYASVYYNLGIVNHTLKNYKEAIKYYDRAIRFNPNDFEAYNNRADSLLKLLKIEKYNIEEIKLLLKKAYDNIKRSISIKKITENEYTLKQIKDFAKENKIDLDSL